MSGRIRSLRGTADRTRFAGLLEEEIRRSRKQLDTGQREVVATLTEPVPHGFYLWGDVGRGKTMLADLFAAAASDQSVTRVHFHTFLRELHRQIAAERAPLSAVLARMLGGTQVLVFDEFHVHDVADAVFLTAVLEHVLKWKITLVATSNYQPRDLLPDPLFHHRMEPAIALIEAHLTVVGIGDGPDHRSQAPVGMRSGFTAGRWIVDEHTVAHHGREDGRDKEVMHGGEVIRAAGIPVRTHRIDGKTIVFTFKDLCEQAVGTHQYLWLAEQFDEVRVVDVPDLAAVGRDGLLRFALLVDMFSDRDTTLTVRASGEPSRILEAEEPPRDAARTVSRLALLVR